MAILLAAVLMSGTAWAAKVDINKADAAALIENLEGVGPVKAKAIVDYRKKNGKFKTYDDLIKVPGIGVETVKKNKSSLSLSGGITKATSKSKSSSKTSSSTSKSTASKSSTSSSSSKTSSADKKVKAKKDDAKAKKEKAKAKKEKAKNDAKKKAKSSDKDKK